MPGKQISLTILLTLSACSLPTAVSAQLEDVLLIQCAYDAIAPTQSSAWAAVADVKTYEKCYKKWSDDDKVKLYLNDDKMYNLILMTRQNSMRSRILWLT